MATKEDLDKIKEALGGVKAAEVTREEKSVGIIAQEVSKDDITLINDPTLSPLTTIDISTLNSLWGNITCNGGTGSSSSGSILGNGANGSGGSYLTGSMSGTYNWHQPGGPYTISTTPLTTTKATLKVAGDANFDGDIKWKGRSLGDMLETIESRLAILVPDPEKLEHFEALKKAYEHYKTLEALCTMPTKDDTEH